MSDRIAKQVITIGGIGTIFVVMLVVFVLVGNVLPLFQANRSHPLGAIPSASSEPVLAAGVDEYGEVLWTLDATSTLRFYSVSSGEVLETHSPVGEANATPAAEGGRATCVSVSDDDASLLVGYADGSVRPITFGYQVAFLKASELPAEVQFTQQDWMVFDGAIYRQTNSGLIRRQRIDGLVFHPSVPLFASAVVAVDWKTPQAVSSFDASVTWLWGATDGNALVLARTDNKVNAITDAVSQESTQWQHRPERDPSSPWYGLMIDSRGTSLAAVDRTGKVTYWNAEEDGKLLASKTHLSLAGSESQLTCTTPLLGRTSFVLGAESGHIEAVAMSAVEQTQELMSIHRFEGDLGSVKSMAASPTARVLAGIFEDGDLAIYYVPTNRRLAKWKVGDEGGDSTGSKVQSVVENKGASVQPSVFFSSNAEVVGAVTDRGVSLWRVTIPHPEASWMGFFGRLWYEGYPSPQHVWQSSTGNIEGEYKFGFMPLIFGTFKATFYSMLIGAPIALMAAIFGSEFMSSRWRTRFKPAIELMASVPSVVLGFIGALVLAPLLRDHLMACLLAVPMVLFLFLLGAHCWLLLPNRLAIRAKHWRLPILIVLIPIGVYLATLVAAPLEEVLFGGSVTQWLAGQIGSGWPGWFSIGLLPIALLVAWVMSGPLNPRMQSIAASMTPFRFAIFNLGFFLLGVVSVFVLSALIATALHGIGLDPRGPVLGPYQERNALLVGCILGFAIIPLIYTISEDALQSVPQHLRSASLGCGATTWQTTIRVVVPTAMSGLFSAMMIGFGRAVGETMVVLMAAGNTPLMDINPMNGYRTLSATLATELPEAARGSTHYHGLFLAALLLFCFTLVANTVAELVRMRFRKRAYQL
ncbi:Phosphate transport system permease protein PstC [Pirellula sp. SH-Sr6A]|uniref:ABC transporter permease subunit n=1 Tax=Pirellula sp. SH-Sr6A TaxID=1632865 RepID=UPI00078ECBEA|nr:ABC transporter permease subunit [Pirellula sp. SH-Sr6A]AMV34149.1 Phosphate transport system permease protein PstC [Pirellula sp. SH-Sr6A]